MNGTILYLLPLIVAVIYLGYSVSVLTQTFDRVDHSNLSEKEKNDVKDCMWTLSTSDNCNSLTARVKESWN